MVATSIQSRPAQRKPALGTILAVWRQECHDSGRRGAYRRAAERLGVSPDTVERAVHRDEARRRAQVEQEAAGLAFVAPDPAYEATRDAANQAAAAEITARLAAALTAKSEQRDRVPYVELERGCGEIAAGSPLEVAAEPRTDELDVESPEVPEPPQPVPEAEPVPVSEPQSPETPMSPLDLEPQVRSGAPRLYDRAAKTPQPVPQPEPLPLPEPVPIPDPLPMPTPDPIPVPPMPGPNPVQASPIVIRQVVRVPIEARRSGLVAWSVEHEAAAKQIAALAIVIMLVLLSRLG